MNYLQKIFKDLSINNNVYGKLISLSELSIMFDDSLEIISVLFLLVILIH